MEARIVEPDELTPAEIALWRELQATDRSLQSPFLAPEFTRAIGLARADVLVAVLRRGGQTRGFLPFHRCRSGVGKPVGGPIADFQGPLLEPGLEPEGAELLAACRLKAYDYNHGPASVRLLRQGAVHRETSPHIDLTAGYASYVKGRPKGGRHAIKETDRRLRKVERECGPLRFEFHDATEHAWDWVVATKTAAYRRMGVPSALSVPWIVKALRAIQTVQQPTFAVCLSTLYAGDRLIAANLGMRSETILCWWFNTYDETLRSVGPGLILLLKAAERAAGDGLALIDLGRGDEAYKRTFANGAIEVCEGSIEQAVTFAGAVRRTQKAALRTLARVPLGRFESWPRRAAARLVTGMHLP